MIDAINNWLDTLDHLVRAAAGIATFIIMANQIVLARRTKSLTVTTQALSTKIDDVHDNVVTIEKATNSMKDALVASTAKASHAEGVLDEKVAAQLRSDAATP